MKGVGGLMKGIKSEVKMGRNGLKKVLSKSKRFAHGANNMLENVASKRLLDHKKALHDAIHKAEKMTIELGGDPPGDVENYMHAESQSYLLPDTVDENMVSATAIANGTYKKRNFVLYVCAVFVGVFVSASIALAVLIFGKIEKARVKATLTALKDDGSIGQAWLIWTGSSLGCALFACAMVLWQPSAASSGIPGLISFLNGSIPHAGKNIFGRVAYFDSFHVLAAKYIGMLFSIPSGLCVGPEGPIIHCSALIGKFSCALYQKIEQKVSHSDSFSISPDELRDFLAAGAAAGITTAFHAPLAGVLFVVEEAATFFTVRAMELTFCSCLIAYWVSFAIDGFPDDYVKFLTPSGPACSDYSGDDVFCFLIMAVIGGWLGAGFNEIVEHCNHLRIHHVNKKPVRRVLEVVFMVLLTGLFAVLLPLGFDCIATERDILFKDSSGCMPDHYRTQISSATINAKVAWELIDGVEILDYAKQGSAEWKVPAQTVKCLHPNYTTMIDTAWKNSSDISVDTSSCVTLLANFKTNATDSKDKVKHEIYVRTIRLEIAFGLKMAYQKGCSKEQNDKAISDGYRKLAFEEHVMGMDTENVTPTPSLRRLAAAVANANSVKNFCEEGYWYAHTDIMVPHRADEYFEAPPGGEIAKPENYVLPDYGHPYNCKKNDFAYNDMALLWLNGGLKGVKNLLMRGVPHLISIEALLVFFVCYFFLASITAGISVPGGLVVPMLLIGGSYGRSVGLLMMTIKKSLCSVDGYKYESMDATDGDTFFWSAIMRYKVRDCRMADPGLYAVIGSAAFMGGSGRITLFLATVLLELTNDIRLVAPIGCVTLFSMLVGNLYNHGLYHGLLHLLDIPFLEHEGSHVTRITPTSWVMATPVKTAAPTMKKGDLEKLLDGNFHNGFPVVDDSNLLVGLLTRHDVKHSLDYIKNDCNDDANVVINSAQFMDLAPISVKQHTKLYRTHDIFVSLGMRHLCVTDINNKLVGMITRKDLQPHRLAEVTAHHKEHVYDDPEYHAQHEANLEIVAKNAKYPEQTKKIGGIVNHGRDHDHEKRDVTFGDVPKISHGDSDSGDIEGGVDIPAPGGSSAKIVPSDNKTSEA